MAGTYNGSIHGGNEFEGDDWTDVFARNRQRALLVEENIREASQNGTRAVVSSDGQRVLSLPVTRGPGVASAGSGGTRGPGAASAGGGHTTGPGASAVAPRTVAVGGAKGPGTAAYITMPDWSPLVWNGVDRTTSELSGSTGPDQVTEVWIGGWKAPRDPATSDAQAIEDSMGEGDLLSPGWFAQWGAAGANAWYGVTRSPAAKQEMQKQNDVKALIDGAYTAKQQQFFTEYVQQGGMKPGQIPF